jgi:plastocyanin
MRRLLIGTTVLALALAACGGQTGTGDEDGQQEEPASVSVQAHEYEFSGVPDTLAAGRVTFGFENVGEEPHEFQLARITSDLPLEEIVGLPEDEAMENIEPAGGTFAEPGGSAEFEATLEAGRYGYVCFVESPEGEPHAALGMFGEFTVE